MAVTIVDEKGVSRIIPTSPRAEFIAPGIKVQASELLGSGEMIIVIACVAINPSLHGEPPKTLIAPHRPPKWIHILGTYEITEGGSQKRFHLNDVFQLAGKLAR